MDTVALQPDGKILIAGIFSAVGGTNQAGLARLHADGRVDTTFRPPQIFGGFAPVNAVAVQEDGRILIAGFFKTPAPFSRTNIARLLPDGSVDPSFVAGTDNTTECLLLLPGGKILVGGFFHVVNGQARGGIARLESDGRVDTSFTVSGNQGVQAMFPQPDGKILLSGQFTVLGGQSRKNLARLNRDGGLDAAFDPGAILNPTPNDGVHALALQPDGRILAAGFFINTNELGRRELLRFYPDGTFDRLFPAVSNVSVRTVVAQPDGKILVGGGFNSFLGQSRTNLARLNFDGSVDSAFTANVSGGVGALKLQGDGKIVVAGGFTNLAGQARKNIGRLRSDGTLDATLSAGADRFVQPTAVQADGKIILGGRFTMLAGQARTNLGRLNPDGTLDTAFADAGGSPGADLPVITIAVQDDGKILVGGDFSRLGGESRTNIGRLNPDGTADAAFNPGAWGRVFALKLQPDGKILVGGELFQLGGASRAGVGRLYTDGTVDTEFNPVVDGRVATIAVQSDAKILLGGLFSTIAGQPRSRLGRVNPDGTLDVAFNPNITDTTCPGCANVIALCVQRDGKILVGGSFNSVASQTRNHIARLNPDGTLDALFNPGANSSVLSFALQTDASILVAGNFSTLGGQTLWHLGRLFADGTADTTFDRTVAHNAACSVCASAYGVAVQSDGYILVGGSFDLLSGQARTNFGRLTSGSEAFQKIEIDARGATCTWLRSGSSPEVEQVTFEKSPDGTNYTLLGAATPVAGGWQLTGLSLPAGQNFYIRAHGRATGGYNNGSSSLIESVAQFYRIPSPQIIDATQLNNGAFQFAFSNLGHHSFTVLATTNLVSSITDWQVLGSPTNIGSGLYQFIDPASATYPQRFYQLRSQ